MSPAAREGDVLIGRLLAGRYRIQSRLARGGMASVYRATDERLERPVAVKVLAAPYADDPAFADRFLAEARTAASFSHQNLAHVYDSGSGDGMHFMVLELLERHRSLREELERNGPLPSEQAARVAVDVLAGLEPLHGHGLVHCDVKPGNVMIGREGTKLIDFGIARSLRHAAEGVTSIGSLHAMSPEQLRGEPLTPVSDLFAVGVLLYESLTGRVPFRGASPEEVAAAHASGPPAAPSALVDGIPARMDGIVLQALRQNPTERFASAAAMGTALRAALEEGQDHAAASPDDETTELRAAVAPAPPPARPAAPPPTSPSPPHPPSRRGPRASTALAVLAAVAVPALVVGVVMLGSPGDDRRPTPDPAAGDSPRQTPTLAPGSVRVPDTIGLSESEAQAAAQQAGLAWRLEWRVVPGRTPGVYRQEPAPGTVVERGAPFVMYAYRSR